MTDESSLFELEMPTLVALAGSVLSGFSRVVVESTPLMLGSISDTKLLIYPEAALLAIETLIELEAVDVCKEMKLREVPEDCSNDDRGPLRLDLELDRLKLIRGTDVEATIAGPEYDGMLLCTEGT